MVAFRQRLQKQEKLQLPLCDLIMTETFAIVDVFIGPVCEHEEYVNRSVLVGYLERLKILKEVKKFLIVNLKSMAMILYELLKQKRKLFIYMIYLYVQLLKIIYHHDTFKQQLCTSISIS